MCMRKEMCRLSLDKMLWDLQYHLSFMSYPKPSTSNSLVMQSDPKQELPLFYPEQDLFLLGFEIHVVLLYVGI